MLRIFALAAVLAAVATVPAAADDMCGEAPYPPAIDKPDSLASKPVETARAVVKQDYDEVKAYQAQLKDFRACLDGQNRQDQFNIHAAQQKKDSADEVARLQEQIDARRKTYDATVDSETNVATEFNALHTAHCQRDTDPMVCPKKQ